MAAKSAGCIRLELGLGIAQPGSHDRQPSQVVGREIDLRSPNVPHWQGIPALRAARVWAHSDSIIGARLRAAGFVTNGDYHYLTTRLGVGRLVCSITLAIGEQRRLAADRDPHCHRHGAPVGAERLRAQRLRTASRLAQASNA